MITLFSIFLLLPIPVLLNRWRGTGAIFNIFGFRLIGNIIYAIYIAVIVGCAYAITFGGWLSVGYGLLGGILYIIGESFAWGKWVGWLTNYNDVGKPDYNNDDGRSFPYIHYIAQSIIKQEENYKRYCQVALAIRGFIWWTPLLILLGCINLLDWSQVIISSLVLSIAFPLGCELSKYWDFEYKSKFLSISGNWEKQEVIYGLFQFVCITLSILIYKGF